MPQPIFKTAPSIPGTEKALICKKFIHNIAKSLPCNAIAIRLYQQGAGEIQTHHTDETFAVNLLHIVAHQNCKGLNCCHRNKLLYILKRVQRNMKFLHLHALLLYKFKIMVYNNAGLPTRTSIDYNRE